MRHLNSAAIEWIAHAVEIVQSHHPGWQFRLPDCTADNGLHGRLVVDRGVGANVLGSPLLVLAHLVGVLSRQPEAPPLPGLTVTFE